MTATTHESSWPTRSAPTGAACGTSRPTRSSTRTASARTSARSRKPIRRLRDVWGCSSPTTTSPCSTLTATARSGASNPSGHCERREASQRRRLDCFVAALLAMTTGMRLQRARVVTLNAALGPLDYRVPDGMPVEAGSIVVAPLGPRQLLGVAWEPERLPTNEVPDTRLRPLAGLVAVPPIAAPLRRLCEWTADYYLSPLASVLRMFMPSSAALDGPRQLTEYRPT